MPYLSIIAGHCMQLLLEGEYIKVDDIIDEIRVMGDDRSHPSGQGVRSKQVLLQTIEEILKENPLRRCIMPEWLAWKSGSSTRRLFKRAP